MCSSQALIGVLWVSFDIQFKGIWSSVQVEMCLSKLCTLLCLADYFFHKLFSDISKNIFIKFLDTNQLWGVVDVIENLVAIQRDPASSERWADRNTIKISTGKCQVLHRGRNRKDNPPYTRTGWGQTGWTVFLKGRAWTLLYLTSGAWLSVSPCIQGAPACAALAQV